MNFKGGFFLGHPVCRSRLQKKKSGVKKCLEIMTIRGGGGRGRCLMAKTILNFHFDSLKTRLIQSACK